VIPDLLLGALCALLGLGILFGLGWGLYFCVSLPLRREERARLFLDVVETGLNRGQSLEHTTVSASTAGDRILGARFHLLAAYLESGMDLGTALNRVPHFLPPSLRATLQAGAEAVCLPKILEACRRQLRDGVAQVWKAQHFLALMALIATPVWLFVFWTLVIFVFPKFQAIAEDMGAGSWPLLRWLLDHATGLIAVQAILFVGFYLCVLLYLGGPRLIAWVNRLGFDWGDRLAFALPWQRQRILRNFSATLAALLDAGLPEARALKLAADGTANQVFRHRAAVVGDELARGVKLAEAVQRIDATGEFRWRLANASQGTQGFWTALAGWHEALDVRAFRQEQILAQVVTSALVFINGLMVGCVAVAVFQLLLSILNAGLLW
jgi:type II secretory pathway component PulF